MLGMNDRMIDLLVKELDDRGWSQRELARRAGISQSTVSDVIAGKRPASWDFAAATAKALGYSPDYFFVLAGLRSKPSPSNEEYNQLLAVLTSLPEGVYQALWVLLEALTERQVMPPDVAENLAMETVGELAGAPLTEREQAVLENYRALPQHLRDLVVAVLDDGPESPIFVVLAEEYGDK